MIEKTYASGTLLKGAFLLCLLAAGCTHVPENLSTPTDTNRSVVAIAVETASPVSIFSSTEAQIFFVKLESPDSVKAAKIIESNHFGGEYAYLIDAEPGVYAAVASYFNAEEKSFTTVFDRKLIESTRTVVRGGEIAFMGRYRIKSSGSVTGRVLNEEIQKHYYRLIRPLLENQVYLYSGSPESSVRDTAAEKEFLARAKKVFRKTEWLPIIESRINVLTSPERAPETKK